MPADRELTAEQIPVALVCDYSLDYLGGAQTAFCAQVRALENAGHRVTVIAPRGKRADIGASHHEWIDVRLTLPGLGLPLRRSSRALRRRIGTILESRRIAVVHAHSEFGIVAATVEQARERGIAVVHTVHTFFWRSGLPAILQPAAAALIAGFHRVLTGQRAPRTRLPGPAADVALRAMTLGAAVRADAVVSPSVHQAQRLREAGVARVLAVPNTLEPRSGERPAALECVQGPVRIVWVGRLVAEKRPLEFIAACVRVVAESAPGSLSITIVGDGPDRAAAEENAAGCPDIRFIGRVSSERVLDFMAEAHVVALTSSGFDNQPMTIVEAMYCARGVFYVDPNLEEGAGQAGFLCPDDSVAAMAQTLHELIADPARVIAQSRSAVAAFGRFSPDGVARELSTIYREVTQSPEPPRSRSSR